MITKSKIKLIKSLAKKKSRDLLGLFVVEGYKSIRELKNSGLSVEEIYVTVDASRLDDLQVTQISAVEMKAISNLKTPPGYLAVVQMNKNRSVPDTGLIIALDSIQDPGNLGTIVRLADWFNIKHIVCNNGTVDLYNPKCIQATMGSIARVQVHYLNLDLYLEESKLPVYVTSMTGNNIYKESLTENAILVMGSESHGISESIMQKGNQLSIPRYGAGDDKTESLNVATATGIILAEWRRSTGK